VEQARLDADHVHRHFREDLGDGERVSQVGLTGIALLVRVLIPSELVGLAQGVEVLIRPGRSNRRFELLVELVERRRNLQNDFRVPDC
jgi:hypothetical protein